jgi:hypothetical protein
VQTLPILLTTVFSCLCITHIIAHSTKPVLSPTYYSSYHPATHSHYIHMAVTKSIAPAPRCRPSVSKQFMELKNRAISPKDRPAFIYFFTLPGSAPAGKIWGKLGISNDIRRRQREWHRQCKGVKHVWSPVTRFTRYAYKHERLAHLALMKIGITRPLQTCPGCKLSFLTFADLSAGQAAGGIERSLSSMKMRILKGWFGK